MKKNFLMLMATAALVMSMFTSCDLFSTITVDVTNYNSMAVKVEYRESGSTTWLSGLTMVDELETKSFDLPSPGIYDFRVVDYIEITGFNVVEEVLLSEDCTSDYGAGTDYYLSISSSGTISFY